MGRFENDKSLDELCTYVERRILAGCHLRCGIIIKNVIQFMVFYRMLLYRNGMFDGGLSSGSIIAGCANNTRFCGNALFFVSIFCRPLNSAWTPTASFLEFAVRNRKPNLSVISLARLVRLMSRF